MGHETVDAFVEGNGTTAWHATFRLAFWTRVEIAQPSQISVGSRFDQKDFNLVIGGARAISTLIASAQRRISGAPQRI